MSSPPPAQAQRLSFCCFADKILCIPLLHGGEHYFDEALGGDKTYLYGSACRKVFGDSLAVCLVHAAEILHIGEICDCVTDVVPFESGGLESPAEGRKGLPCLRLHVIFGC